MITTYEAVYDDSTLGVFGISLVENPATEEYFIKLSEDEKAKVKEKTTDISLSTINEEQRILLGLVLEPNVPIYRNQDGEEFNIVFNNETVQTLAHSFISNGYQGNSTFEHDEKDKVVGVSFVESWMVDDPKKDKSNAYGLEYQKGSWLVAMKVNNDEVWNDYIKTGKVQGFSIDAVVKLKEVKQKSKKDVKMTLTEKVTKLASEFAIKLGLTPKPIHMGTVPIEGEELIFEYEGDTLEVGGKIMAVDPTDMENKVPVPVGQYPLETGEILVVTEEGIITEVKPKEGEEATKEEPAPAPSIDEPVEAASDMENTVNEIKSILIKYEESLSKVAVLEESVNSLKEELTTVKQEVVEFAEQPSKKPKVQMASVPLNKEGRLLAKLREQ